MEGCTQERHRSIGAAAEGRQAPLPGLGEQSHLRGLFAPQNQQDFLIIQFRSLLSPPYYLPNSTYIFLTYFSFNYPSFPYFTHSPFLESWIWMSISAHLVLPLATPLPSGTTFGNLEPSFYQFVHPGTHSFIKPRKPAAAEGILSHGKPTCPSSVESSWQCSCGGDHGLDPPELPARWWKDTMYLTLSPYYANFLGPVQLVISKGVVKCWIETLLKSVSVSSFLPKSWIRPWECICLFFPCHQPAFGWKL